MNSYEMSRQYSQYKSKLAVLSEKKAPVHVADTKKRKKITPQSSPSDEGIRKKRKFLKKKNIKFSFFLIELLYVESIAESGITPPDASNFIQKMNASKNSVITIEDDDEEYDEQPPSWNQPNSMKIEALISKRTDQT